MDYRMIDISCDVEEHIPVILIPSKIFLLHQPVDPLLDDQDVGNEMSPYGLDRLSFYLLVRELLACLHDTHNRCIEVMLPVTLDGSLRALRFLRLKYSRSFRGDTRRGRGKKYIQSP
jgi:hypothetical protein